MQLDVIIATHNREELLKRALDSLLEAEIPLGLEVQITVVDNRSTDATRRAVESRMGRAGGRLHYVYEDSPGKSHALNAGIAATRGDLVGMIDDDEEVHSTWYECAFTAFRDKQVDFVGGPYIPRWSSEPPEWLPQRYKGAVGWVAAGDDVRPYDESFPGILMGGNAIIRRNVLDQIGPYSTLLCHTGDLLLMGEDDDMYERLLRAGARGIYIPDLIIYHYVPPERLTRRYFRRWCFWRGVSHGILGRDVPKGESCFAGIPHWRYGAAARGLLGCMTAVVDGNVAPGEQFARELDVWSFAGFVYGRHLFRLPAEPVTASSQPTPRHSRAALAGVPDKGISSR